MSTTYEIPLTPQPQTFNIVLGAVQYALTLVWNTAAQAWLLDIADNTGVPLVNGIPLVTGADLLAQYAYLELGGALYVQTDSNADALPTYSNLGTDSHLYFVVA